MFVMAFLLYQTKYVEPGILNFLVIFRPPPLLVIERAFSALIILDANDLLQHRLKVDWLSNKSTFLRSKLVNFLDFRARTTLE